MAERRRILLAEIAPRVPGARTYAVWNPLDKSANITLANANLDAYAGATNFGAVRATIPMRSGQWYWELRQSVMPSSGYVSAGGIGVYNAASLSAGNFGFDTNPIVTQSGPRTNGAGQCYTGGIQTGTVGAPALNDVISFWYDADAGIMRVRRNGGGWQHLGRRAGLTGDPWYPMAQLSRNARYRANFGASPFAYAVPHGVNPGVYATAATTATTVYLGSDSLITGAASGKVPANTHYEGRIASNPDLITSREVSCWVWGGQTRSSRGQLAIVNTDGALDGWGDWYWRDAEVKLYAGYAGDARSDFVLRSTERVESINDDGNRWTITLADQLALLDVATPRPTYGSATLNTQLQGEPMPLVFGRPLYCRGKKRSTSALGNDAFAYDLSDAPVRIDAIYDRGDIFTNVPANWAYTQDGIGFKLTSVPDEPVVANPAGPWNFGGSDTMTSLNGGDFTSWSGSPVVPTGWSQLGTAWTSANRWLAGSPAGARALATGSQMVQMVHSGTVHAAGTYRITFTVSAVTTAGVLAFVLGTGTAYCRVDRVGKFCCLITTTSAAQLQMLVGNDGSNALGALDVTITSMRTRSATLVERLADWVKYLVVDLGGGLTLDTAASAALQAAADYRLAHYSTSEEVRLSILRATMDGWCGWLVPKLSGELTVGRIDLPAAAPALTLTDAHIKTLRWVLDVAPSLTTRLAGRRNHTPHADGDIAGAVGSGMREELTRDYTVIREAQPSTSFIGRRADVVRESIVSSDVEQADGARAKTTLLQDADDIQAEISRVASLWRDSRRIYTVECVLGAADADALEPGQTVRVVWPRHGLAAGKNLRVVGVTTRFWSRVVQLRLWG